MSDELQTSIDHLRTLINAVEFAPAEDKTVPEGLGLAVDDLRRTLWGALTTTFASDAQDYLIDMRVRRASEMCQDILADLLTGAMTPQTPGTDELATAVRDLRTAIQGIR